jgi:hypothetical protein
MTAFSDIAAHSLVAVDRYFRDVYCLRSQSMGKNDLKEDIRPEEGHKWMENLYK